MRTLYVAASPPRYIRGLRESDDIGIGFSTLEAMSRTILLATVYSSSPFVLYPKNKPTCSVMRNSCGLIVVRQLSKVPRVHNLLSMLEFTGEFQGELTATFNDPVTFLDSLISCNKSLNIEMTYLGCNHNQDAKFFRDIFKGYEPPRTPKVRLVGRQRKRRYRKA